MTFTTTPIQVVRVAAYVLAIIALLLSTYGRRLGLISYAPGGSAFDTIVYPIFVAMFIVALLVSMKWEIAGGLIAAFAAAGLMAFATQQLRTTSALIVVAAFAIPGLLWLLIDIHDLSMRRGVVVMTAAGVISVTGFLLGTAAYEHTWGPTHPDSQAVVLPDSPALWVWSGQLGTDTATVKAKARGEFSTAQLLVGKNEDLSSAHVIESTGRSDDVASFRIEGLDADTQYFYAVRFDDALDEIRMGRFETFPSGPSSFTVVFGACARVGSNGRVFDTINDLEPLLYMILGDFHYGDNDVDDVDDYREVLDITLTQPGQAELYRSRGISYIWDDHDFGSNDANGSSVARAAAMTSYREYVPSYELAGPLSAIYQAFTIGRVRFVMTDARSSRGEQILFDDDEKSMLGAEQKAWLFDELADSSESHELVVWINPVPWVTQASEGADSWGGYATERAQIANYIADNEIDNLLMVSGDAHMVAIDDGTNTNFSDTPGPGFPLLHAAALDRPGSTKGGPYSEGAIGGGGQFGVLDVVDENGRIEVTLRALDWQGEELLSYSYAVPPNRS